jgi:hypothetical protein
MSRTYICQDTQVRKSDEYDDSILPSEANMETNPVSIEDDLNSLRSQVRRWLWADSGNNWYDDLPTITSIGSAKKRGINDLAVHVDALEEHRILFRSQILTDITVPSAVKATGTLTLNSAPSNNDTVTIGSTTYTFKTTLTPSNWEVLIEASASDSLDNLIWAINNTAGHPGKFQVPNAHPDVTAAAGTGDTMDVEAIIAGTKANLVSTTETFTDPLSVWGAAALTGGAGDIVVLSVSGSETPSEHGAVGAVTTKGAVVAYNSDFSNWKLVKVAGVTAITPKNLCIVRNAADGEMILSGGKDVYALLACEDATDDQVFDDTTKQVELIFVRENSSGTDLEQVPGVDIGGKSINYSYVRRVDFDNLPETAFLSEVFIDQAGAVDVTRQNAYDNQGTTPVDLLTNAILDIETSGAKWEIRDTNEASLFKITENAVGSATELAIGSDVDVFNVDAIAVDFDKGITVDSGGVDIQIGKTSIANVGTIETLSGNDLRMLGAREMFLDDGNQAGSTWTQTSGIKLSDTTQEWDDFETAFGGEVSLLKAITMSMSAAARSKLTAVVSAADIPATTLIEGPGGPGTANISADLCDYRTLTFDTDVDVYINGALQWNGSANDVYGSAVTAEQQYGCFYANFNLRYRGGTNPDVITMISWA